MLLLLSLFLLLLLLFNKPANVESCLADFYNHNASNLKHESRGE